MNSTATPTETTEGIEFFFDPLCPWAWVTSRFAHEVADQTALSIRWRLISLAILNAPDDGASPGPPWDHVHEAGTRMLRVAAATTAHHGNDAAGRLYTELGTRLHTEGGSKALREGASISPTISDALAAADLPSSLADAAHDAAWDTTVRTETDIALSRTGDDVGTPVITFDPSEEVESSYFGPVINRIPRGDEALRIWDAVTTLARTPGVAELKRSDRGTPTFD